MLSRARSSITTCDVLLLNIFVQSYRLHHEICSHAGSCGFGLCTRGNRWENYAFLLQKKSNYIANHVRGCVGVHLVQVDAFRWFVCQLAHIGIINGCNEIRELNVSWSQQCGLLFGAGRLLEEFRRSIQSWKNDELRVPLFYMQRFYSLQNAHKARKTVRNSKENGFTCMKYWIIRSSLSLSFYSHFLLRTHIYLWTVINKKLPRR